MNFLDDTKIKCFLYAAECLNFTDAAAHMYITQPALSRNIASLESELGFSLFIRNNKHKSCRLSPQGAVMYHGICKLKEDYTQIYNKAKRIHRGEEGKLSIGFLNGFRMDEKIQNVIKQCKQLYQGMDVEIISCDYNELIKKLYTEELDVAITLELEVKGKPGIVYEKLFEAESYLVVPKKMNLDENHIYSINDFMSETFIFSKDSEGITNIFRKVIEKLDIYPKIIEAPDFNTQMLWIESGMGIAGNGKGHLLFNSPNVQYLKVEEFHPLNFVAAWNKDNYNPTITLFYTNYELMKLLD